MKYPVYCIRDNKVGFAPQFHIQENEVASIRAFKFMLDGANLLGKFPEDYDWYQVAEFDTESGNMIAIIPPKFIVSGGSVVNEK